MLKMFKNTIKLIQKPKFVNFSQIILNRVDIYLYIYLKVSHNMQSK